jgi:hypothetical protein
MTALKIKVSAHRSTTSWLPKALTVAITSQQKSVDPMHNSEIFRLFTSENQVYHETAENGTSFYFALLIEIPTCVASVLCHMTQGV